ncbi:MAG: HAMP domain-containing protein [Krumholzibacteria bacterium]|nr:HAMP domain-containing protein [Candidatus Krumholzibacteria bacterium]
MPRGIARKLILYLTLMVIVVEGVFAVFNIRSQERQLLQEMTLSADLLSQTIVSTTWHAMLEDRRERVYEMMNNVGRQESIEKVRIFNKTGRIMFSSGDDGNRTVDTGAEACDMCHAVDRPLVQVDVPTRTRIFRRPEGGRVLGMVTPIYNEPSCSNAACHAHPAGINVLGVVDVTMPLDRVDRQVAGVRFQSFLVSAVSVVVLFFFVVLFSRRFVQQPVRRLIEATQQVGVHGGGAPVRVEAEDELGELAHSFAVMQERLRASDEQVREFTETLERQVEERTQRLRETERKLIQNDRLASLGQLAASVAHEINNPLAGVVNFGKLMQRVITSDGVPRERAGEFRIWLDHIVTETVRCGHIVRDLLVFSRQSAPCRAAYDLNEIILRTLAVIRHRLELGGVEARTELAGDLPPVFCDASQVQQIVTNLVINGAEAMETGAVTVRTRRVPGRDAVALEVADTGSGIAPEHLEKLYDPFFSTKQEGQGTGLGLAVVYGIVESHGGQIDVETALGRGTRFTVTLPLRPDGALFAAPAAAGPAGSGAGT